MTQTLKQKNPLRGASETQLRLVDTLKAHPTARLELHLGHGPYRPDKPEGRVLSVQPSGAYGSDYSLSSAADVRSRYGYSSKRLGQAIHSLAKRDGVLVEVSHTNREQPEGARYWRETVTYALAEGLGGLTEAVRQEADQAAGRAAQREQAWQEARKPVDAAAGEIKREQREIKRSFTGALADGASFEPARKQWQRYQELRLRLAEQTAELQRLAVIHRRTVEPYQDAGY